MKFAAQCILSRDLHFWLTRTNLDTIGYWRWRSSVPEWRRRLSSNPMRGVGRDAKRFARLLAVHVARR